MAPVSGTKNKIGCGAMLGYGLLGLGVIFLLLIPLMILDPEAESGAPAGGFMLALMCGVPGGIIVWRARANAKEEALSQQLVGLVYSHDGFTAAELAAKLGLDVAETEARIQELNVQRNLGLAYHRADKHYIHFGRMQHAYQTATHCQSCAASLGHQILFPGEQLTCPYCGSVVAAQHHAPTPQQQPAAAYGAQQGHHPGHMDPHAQQGHHPGHHAPPGQHPRW